MRRRCALDALRGLSRYARLRVCVAVPLDASWAIADAAWGVNLLLMPLYAPLSTTQQCAVQLCI